MDTKNQHKEKVDTEATMSESIDIFLQLFFLNVISLIYVRKEHNRRRKYICVWCATMFSLKQESHQS